MKSNYEIDEETRNQLCRKEQWHFCVLQQGWFTIVVFLTAMFELMIFAVGFFGSDYQRFNDLDPKTDLAWLKFARNFQFSCKEHKTSIWFIDHSSLSMMLFKLHFIVIFMYTTLFMIVLFKIPYKYDRIKKNKEERKAEKKKEKKKKDKRRSRTRK